jgi:hypothetical protein
MLRSKSSKKIKKVSAGTPATFFCWGLSRTIVRVYLLGLQAELVFPAELVEHIGLVGENEQLFDLSPNQKAGQVPNPRSRTILRF